MCSLKLFYECDITVKNKNEEKTSTRSKHQFNIIYTTTVLIIMLRPARKEFKQIKVLYNANG